MAQAVSEAKKDLGVACGRPRFVVGSRRQFWADVVLVDAAILAPAFLYRSLRHHEPEAAAIAWLVLAVCLIGWLFARQLARGERGWMFYSAMLMFAGVSVLGDGLAEAGVAPVWVGMMAVLSAAPAMVGIVGAVRIVRALDEMWRQINYRALAFAFIGTLTVVLGQWLVASFGVEVLTWRRLLLLMVAAWGGGMLWEYRRFK